MTRPIGVALILSVMLLTSCGKRGELKPPADYEDRQQTEEEKTQN